MTELDDHVVTLFHAVDNGGETPLIGKASCASARNGIVHNRDCQVLGEILTPTFEELEKVLPRIKNIIPSVLVPPPPFAIVESPARYTV